MQPNKIEGFRLSPQQKRLWRLHRENPVGYRAQCAVLIRGKLDTEQLKRAVRQVAARHQILRTGCLRLPGMNLPVQVVTDSEPSWGPDPGLAGLDEERRESVVDSLLNGGGEVPFDLSNGRVLHLTLSRLTAEQHLLFVRLPSLFADGSTLELLVREVGRLYSERGGDLEAEEESVQYVDLAEWQNELIEGEETASEREFWKGQDLVGAHSPMLAGEREPAGDVGFDCRMEARPIDPSLLTRLEAFASERRGSTADVLLAGWVALLARLTGQSGLVVGVGCNGRTYEELEQAFGPLAKFLPIRAGLEEEGRFDELLARVAEATEQAPQWQEYFSWEQLETGGDDGEPLCLSFGFDYQPRGSSFEAGGLSFSVVRRAVRADRFKLLLVAAEREGGLVTELHYDSSRIDPDLAARILERFHVALADVIQSPGVRVDSIAIAGKRDREELLDSHNRTDCDFPRDSTVHRLFTEQAARTPDRAALLGDPLTWTFAELDTRSNRLAAYLVSLGVGPEVKVGLFLRRCPELVEGLMAILKAGGAYVPLDPAYPRERLSFMIEDSGASILLTDETLSGRLPAGEAKVVRLDADREAIAGFTEDPIPERATPLNLAYVIYTSGSTGRPKGTMVPHLGLVNYVSWAGRSYGLERGGPVPVHSPLGFDLTVTSLLVPLLWGQTARLLDDAAGAEALERALTEEGGFALVKLTPSHLRVLGQQLSPQAAADGARALVVGGEALRGEHLELWREHGGDVRIVNEYGPTETVVGCCVWEGRAAEIRAGDVPIGRPIANTRLYVLDPEMQPVPAGVPGELYVGGVGVTRGYLSRPGLTAERFVPDPFATRSGGRLYRTGDLCRWRADGCLEYLGRNDHQVKIRGFRIEPGEIESLLEETDSVREAAVIAREDRPGSLRLVAYVVAEPGAEVSSADLRGNLDSRLPDYMVPSAFVFLDALPLTSNGKLDRAALPAPEASGSTRDHVPPASPVEQELARIWCEVLGIERVGVHDNFFELGGDSILSIQVVSRAGRAGLRLSPQQLFRHQTIAELSGVVGRGLATGAEQGAVTGAVPLLPIERWLLEREPEGPAHYNQSVLLELHRKLDPSLLAGAVAELLRHHDALRLRLERTEAGEWRQWIASPDEASGEVFRRIDLRDVARADVASSVTSACSELQTSLDLVRGPVVRVAWLETGEASDRLLVVIHHIAVDGVSWRILLEDLLTGYEQLAAGQPVQLPAKTTSIRAWSERLGEWAATESVSEELSYWREVTGSRPSVLPLDASRGPNTVGSSETVEVSLTAEETRRLLREVPSAYRTRIDEVLLAALGASLREWTASETVLVDVEGHGREEVLPDTDVSRTVGWFTTLYPLRLELGSRESGDLLSSVKEQVRSVPDRGLGYGALRWLTGAAGLESRSEVLFNYLGRFDNTLPEGGPVGLAPESSGAVQSPALRRSHVLEVNGGIAGDRLRLAWTYSGNLHERSTIERWAQSYLSSLRALIAHCVDPEVGGVTPSDFPLAALDVPSLARVVGEEHREIEDIYPLSPVQSGMLFHSLYAPETAVYFEQVSATVRGAIDPASFREAWSAAVERHGVLRTSFAWEGLPEPVQVVRRQVSLPWEERDWRGLEAAERDRRLESFLEEDRRRGFDLNQAPLMRVALLRLADDAWRLVWSHHHLILDGWSSASLLKDVMLAYHGSTAGMEVPVERTRPYRDYIGWLRARDRAAAETFWRDRLAGFDEPTLLLPERAGVESGEGADEYVERRLELSEASTLALERLGRERQVTLNTLVQGVWTLLLARYSGRDDVLFGATVSGRSGRLSGIESMLGMFINTLPVRSRIQSGRAVVDWLREQQQLASEAQEHETTALVDVQGWSDVPSGTPLFDTLLVFENYPIDRSLQQRGAGFEIEDVRYSERTNYPLTLIVAPGARLSLRVAYERRRFADEAVEALLSHLSRLFEALVEDPDRAIDSLPLLSDDERRRVLVEWNDTAADYESTACLHQRFETRAAADPDAIAVVHSGTELSYGELNERANRLAHTLGELGVGPDVKVALCMDRSPELVIGVLATLKAGGAYCPLDPAYPAERLAFMLEQTAAPVLLTRRHLAAALPDHGARTICLDDGWEEHVSDDRSNPVTDVRPDNLLYVIYTSGSTGRPKGVAMPHRSLVNLLAWQDRNPPGASARRTLQFASPSFDVSCQELFATLNGGGTLILVDEDQRRDPQRLWQLIRERRVERIFLPFVALQQLADAAFVEGEPPETLREVITAGEQLQATPAIARLFAGGARRLYNQYGPTESHVVTAHALNADPGEWTALPPIGVPVANTRVYLLDGDLRPVPVGVPGELYIGGVNLARGYLGRPDLTAERFVPDPFGLYPGTCLYRTGDLARWSTAGEIEYLGRIDHQVKIRGYRVELGEIEALLGTVEGVRDGVVSARPDASGSMRLVGYLVPEKETELDTRTVAEALAANLPDYMVPTAWVVLEALPLSPNGKVDRKALPDPKSGPRDLARAYVAPRTPLERKLAGIWSELLGVERVGVRDGFFELGGHSLMATQLMSRVREAIGVELPLREVFEASTVEGLAGAIERARRTPDAPPIRRRREQDAVPMSFAQERQWVLNQLVPDSAFYNLHAAVRVSGNLDPEALERAFVEVASRHEVLRTRFPTIGGRPVPTIDETPGVEFRYVDTLGDTTADRESETVRQAKLEVQRAFDLSTGPLLRATLYRKEDDEHLLLLVMHHIVSDGWSMGVLVREIGALYPAFAEGRPSPLPELPVQYADFAAWQRGWLTGEVLDKQMNYWREQLAELPVLELPTDKPRPSVQTFRGERLRFRIPAEVMRRIEELQETEAITPFMTLTAALQILLGRWAGQEDVPVGAPVANRNRAEIEGLIGFFINTIVVRGDLSGDPSFRELLDRTREVCLGAYAHQDLPFEKLVDEMHPERDMSRAALFQVMFTLQNMPLGRQEIPGGLALEPVAFDTEAVKFDLTLTLWSEENGLTGVWGFNTDLFQPATIERMSEQFLRLLEAAVEDPSRRISQLSLVEADEERRQIVEWNATDRDHPLAVPVPALFEEQVRRTPQAEAVTFQGVSLSFDQLNRRANRLARFLRDRGVGPESRVAVCTERSLETVVAMLAVLKAGGAYLPLDPAHPGDRLAYMLRDSGVGVILTQASLAECLPDCGAESVRLDADREAFAGQEDDDLPPVATPGNLAYVIYTSGSTGRPKGVLLEHRGLVNLVHAQREAFDVRPGDRVLQFASLSFDASVSEVFVTLLSGATLVLAPGEALLPGQSLVDLLEGERITSVTLPPSVLAALPRADFPRLRTLVSAGEALSRDVVARWAPGRRFVNAYGPTENTVCATMGEVSVDDDRTPIGRPMDNVSVYVLDRHLQPQPIGVPGELYLGGVALARGYIGDPGRTAERFVPDPFGEPGGRLYRTGDVCRWLPEGRLEFLRRSDEQVKVRGFRIEPGEIESVLRQHADVREAVVLARPDDQGHERLVAWVVGETATPDESELREYLSTRLPVYMVPSVWVWLAELPRLTSGKLDRRGLADPATARRTVDYVPPRTPLERYLAESWGAALGIERVGVHDDFFELGGDSIKGAILINQLQEKLDQYVYTVALFDSPNIANLSRFLVENYPEAVERLFGAESLGEARAAEDGRLVEADVSRFRQLLRTLPTAGEVRTEPNPAAVFLLSPPRSGSTLTRVMLGGHPKLFAPPELLLLNYDSLEERQRVLANGRDDFWLEGTVRAVMELEGCDADRAEGLLEEMRRDGCTTREFYGWMQERLRGRLLVDKTPHYSLDSQALVRAERDFAEARYIHLVRHPEATVSSFEEARLQVLFRPFFVEEPDWSARRLAELIWLVCHRNILDFLERVPPERKMRLRFEDLVSDPAGETGRLAEFLGLEFHSGMLEPHRERKTRMTDPVRPMAQMLGDIKFHEHKGIDPNAADRWKSRGRAADLGPVTWNLAARFDYEVPAELESIRPADRDDEAEKLLDRLDELSPDEIQALLGEMDPDGGTR